MDLGTWREKNLYRREISGWFDITFVVYLSRLGILFQRFVYNEQRNKKKGKKITRLQDYICTYVFIATQYGVLRNECFMQISW